MQYKPKAFLFSDKVLDG